MKKYETKDSGKRVNYKSGMRRDDNTEKPNLYCWIPHNVPYEEQWLTRLGALATRGANKYGLRNMELANSEEELERFKSSCLRHMFQFLMNEDDEDHFSAVVFNMIQIENVKRKLKKWNGQIYQRT